MTIRNVSSIIIVAAFVLTAGVALAGTMQPNGRMVPEGTAPITENISVAEDVYCRKEFALCRFNCHSSFERGCESRCDREFQECLDSHQ